MNIINESRKQELLNLFQTTPYWQNMAPEKQQKVLELLSWANSTIQNYEGVFWIGRIFQRAFVFFSKDNPGETKWQKKQHILVARGYTLSRVYDDLAFFVGNKTNQGQFRPVFNNVRQVSANNITVLNALNNIQYSDDNNIDYTVHVVYAELNTVLSNVSSIEKLPQGTPIVKYEDGSQWVALDVGYCSEEGGLLKHCGNIEGKTNKDERIWSYRIPSNKIKGLFEPKLTFIFNTAKKTLGEMKGFANAKPDSKYHKYIVSLLSTPGRVNYLQGAGYNSPNNFSINDIDDNLFTKLYELNPDLVNAQLTKGDEYQRLDIQKQKLLKQLKLK